MIVTMMQLRGIMPIIPVRITLQMQHNNRPAETTSMWCDDKPLSFKQGLTMKAASGLVDVCHLNESCMKDLLRSFLQCEHRLTHHR